MIHILSERYQAIDDGGEAGLEQWTILNFSFGKSSHIYLLATGLTVPNRFIFRLFCAGRWFHRKSSTPFPFSLFVPSEYLAYTTTVMELFKSPVSHDSVNSLRQSASPSPLKYFLLSVHFNECMNTLPRFDGLVLATSFDY